MVGHALVGVHGRKKWRRGTLDTAYAPDLLERDFSATRPDERWVADISEFHCFDGKLFLAGIRDLFDKTLVGWAMGERQTTDLVVSALVMARSRRCPDGELVHHCDKGPQYTSLELANRLSDWGLSVSFGSTGDAYDNVAMENIWATAKREIEFLHGPVRQLTKSQLHSIIFEYVEVLYSRQRYHAILGYLTPAKYYATAKVASSLFSSCPRNRGNSTLQSKDFQSKRPCKVADLLLWAITLKNVLLIARRTLSEMT
jgi:transposase InsO family protein